MAGPLLGAVSAYTVYLLLREIWGSCRVGINASARGFPFYFWKYQEHSLSWPCYRV